MRDKPLPFFLRRFITNVAIESKVIRSIKLLKITT